jgi:hypothetical protein
MKFNSLADAQEAYSELESRFEAMRGLQSGAHMVLAALISRHHDYEQLQLFLTSLVEVASNTALGEKLTVREFDSARSLVELLQRSPESKEDIRPLRGQ